MRWIVAASLLLVLSGSTCSKKDSVKDADSNPGSGAAAPAPQDGLVTIKGRLTDEGVECPAMRDEVGILYTLSGDLGGFGPGDQVCVRGRPVEMSICQQGVTIAVVSIGKSCPD